jgi:hypothetical protein
MAVMAIIVALDIIVMVVIGLLIGVQVITTGVAVVDLMGATN